MPPNKPEKKNNPDILRDDRLIVISIGERVGAIIAEPTESVVTGSLQFWLTLSIT